MARIEERVGEVSFSKAWKNYFVGYFDFMGRTTNKGYLSVSIIPIIVNFISGFIGVRLPFYIIMAIWMVISGGISEDILYYLSSPYVVMMVVVVIVIPSVLMIPNLALTVRRLRDIGMRGRGQLTIYLFMSILPYLPPLGGGLRNLMMIFISAVDYKNTTIVIFLMNLIPSIILILLPTGFLATRKEKGIMAFFFKNKRFYEDTE